MPAHGLVTGTGAVSPLGRSGAEFYRRLTAGESAIRPLDRESRGDLQATHVARYDGFSPQPEIPAMKARRLDRGSQFALIACAQASPKPATRSPTARSRSASRWEPAPPAPGR